MNRNRVLVVDDDPIALEVARERLERAGYEVMTHDSGLGTSRLILDIRPEVVLLDIMMPGLSGSQLADLIAKSPTLREVGVILHSGKTGAELREIVHLTGANGAIEKTHDGTRFIQQFDDLVGRLRGRRDPLRP